MLISSEFRMRQQWNGDHQEDAPHFTLSKFRDEIGLKSLFRTTNEMFYERCGVGTVDISFPSNHLMFSKTIKNMNYFGSKNQFPFIIFKESSDKKINK